MVRKNWSCPGWSLSDQTVKTGLVWVNPCQFKLQKVASPNEVLSDYFVKFRSWEWSFARLFCDNQTVIVKFCQFNLWMLYWTSVVLSGRLFRIKTCLWLNSISFYMLWKSKSSQLFFSQHACTSWCAPVLDRHVDCIPSQSSWVEPSLATVIKNYFSSSPEQPLVT